MSAGRILAALAALLIAALAVWKRERLVLERTILIALAVVGLGLYASGVLSDLPNVEHIVADVSSTLGGWTYPIVALLAFLETAAFVGLVVPGETVVIAGGVVAGQGEIDIVLLIGLVWVAVVLGDSAGFWIGHRLGREFLERHGPRVGITRDRLDWADDFFERRGGATIIIGRFIGIGRALVPFICGASQMPYRRYLPYAIVAGGLWSLAMCSLGYLFWRSFSTVVDLVGRATLGLGIFVGVIAAGVWTFRRLRHAEQRRASARRIERAAEHPALRPVAAVVRPLWRSLLAPAGRWLAPRLRFVGRRLTPGGLGLELTTAVAVGAVSTYVFVLYAVTLAGDPGLTPADSELLDVSAELEVEPFIAIAKVVTLLGAFPVVAGVVLVSAVVIVSRGDWIDAIALVVGLAAAYLGVQLAKAGIDRPRPPDGLVSTSGAAWPSGHAAYSTAYVAVAVAAARAGGVARFAALTTGTVLLAVTIGLSRIYLQVHYWSDAAGGWALGVAVFSLCAVIVLVIGYMRQNETHSQAARPAASARTNT